MTKYLDSKGLSYLWQKIKDTYEVKHDHPYVKDDTVIKLGSDDTTGISLVAGVDGAKDSWTIPFASTNQHGIVKSGDTAFTEPATDSDWHKAPVLNGYVYYQNTLADTNTVTAADALTDGQIVLGADSKGIKVAGNTISTAFGASASATAVPTESAITGYVTASSFALEDRTTGEGESATTAKYLVLRDKYNTEIASIDATDFLVDGMLDSVAYKTIEQDGETVTTDTLVLTWNTDAGKVPVEIDLGKYIDVYTDGGGISGISIADHVISVKTTGIEAGKTANVSTDFDTNGNVVGYVDLSEYQKSADLVAFDETDLEAIFASADALYEANGNSPKFPTEDPLVTQQA
jgi:hypothetical protein